MDHLAPPGADDQPMYSAMTANTCLAAQTSRVVVSSLMPAPLFAAGFVSGRRQVVAVAVGDDRGWVASELGA